MASNLNTHRPPPAVVLLIATACAMLLGGASMADDPPYLGSESCSGCHLSKYNEFRVSGHPYKLTKADEAKVRPIPLPEGYRWSDISYVIGGYKWKSRYMDLDGYIITELKDGTPGQNQYNYMTGQWVDYHAGEEDKPYNCGSCHTTGFSPAGSQDGLPGIEGTWVFEGVQCEECHGPSAGGSPGSDEHGYIDDSAAACGNCHIRGSSDAIPASGGFIRHHEQYNELLASPHARFRCVTCHDPHVKSEFSITRPCARCHSDIAADYAGSIMDQREVTCMDCHMSWAAKSATALGPWRGDIRTHLFSINTDGDAQMFTDDGKFVLLDADGQGAATLDFACQSCHLDASPQWIEAKAKNFHGRGWANGRGNRVPVSRRGQ
jgi:hypothetical protein